MKTAITRSNGFLYSVLYWDKFVDKFDLTGQLLLISIGDDSDPIFGNDNRRCYCSQLGERS